MTRLDQLGDDLAQAQRLRDRHKKRWHEFLSTPVPPNLSAIDARQAQADTEFAKASAASNDARRIMAMIDVQEKRLAAIGAEQRRVG